MLIGFIGVPASGKTTLAAQLFCFLKENGANTEIITEEARKYIANYRLDHSLSPNDSITLSDKDQNLIFSHQKQAEQVMKRACPDSTLIISDSSVYNALIYLSEPSFNLLKSNMDWSFRQYDLIFFCHPIINLKNLPKDSNRIHDLNQFEELNKRALIILDLIKPYNHMLELYGTQSLSLRYKEACGEMMSVYSRLQNQL